MKETSTPLLVDIDSHRNVTSLLIRRLEDAPDHVSFEIPPPAELAGGGWLSVTTAEFVDDVSALAKGMMAVGLQPGDAVAIMAPTRYQWAVADLAIWFAGGVVVPVYDTSAPAQVAAIIADAEVVLAIGGDAHHATLLEAALDLRREPTIGVWVMDAPTGAAWPSLRDLSSHAEHVTDLELEIRRTLATPDSPATIVYTSGTTGEPKGAVLTHRNFLGQVLGIADAYREVVHENGNTIIFLPLAHVLARGLQLICLASGMRIAHLSDTSAVVETLSVLRPTFLVVVPRVLQKIQAAAAAKAADKGLARVWSAAQSTAVARGRSRERGQAGGLALRARHALFDRLFYGRLREVMGGRLTYILSGGATLDPELSLFFAGLGVPVIEGYGLTETTAPLTGNLPHSIRSGTVGRPLPGTTVRISDIGEILAKGVGVFSGYRSAAHDADAFVDGFFRTGDLGSLDEEGRLVLEGRLKDVIVTSNGKTVVPTRWENAVEADPLVSHAVMVGEGRQYLSALLLLDPLETAKLADDGGLHERVQRIVDAANSLVSHSEQVRRFSLIDADLEDPKLVTPTLKLKRAVALARSASAIDALYLVPSNGKQPK